MNFRKELESLLNKASKENDSDTPDWILAQYIDNCLNAFSIAVRDRDRWWAPKNPHKEPIDEYPKDEEPKQKPAPTTPSWPISPLPSLPSVPSPWESFNPGSCPKCGIELKGVMGYCCPHAQCPTGLGGAWSSMP